MTTDPIRRRAACSCGALSITCTGAPVRVSVCHCLACRVRTGSAFGWQARWPDDAVRIEGAATEWTRTGDEGSRITYRFCPVCGRTVYYTNEGEPGFVAVPAGGFADVDFPAPTVSVYDPARVAPWLTITAEPLERLG